MNSSIAGDQVRRSRAAAWMAGSGAAGLALIAGLAWFVVPSRFPEFTIAHSPWAAPVMRAAIVIYRRDGSTLGLQEWSTRDKNHEGAIEFYVKSGDSMERKVAAEVQAITFAIGAKPGDAEEFWLLYLKSPYLGMRLCAVLSLMLPSSIPKLMAMGQDADPDVAQAVQKALLRLHR
jgi:hypothetical protein